MSAAHYKVDNIVAIVDRNKLQGKAGATEDVMAVGPLMGKLESCGWSRRTIDGNAMTQVCEALAGLPFGPSRPSAIIGCTSKGKGVSFIENTNRSHVTQSSEAEIRRALEELEDK